MSTTIAPPPLGAHKPPNNPAGRGHDGKTRARAIELVDAGWSVYRTVRIMRKEGLYVTDGTVKRWVDPKFNELEIERVTRNGRKRRASSRQPARGYTDDFKLERMRELRERGLSFLAIGQVAAVWWGEELSDEVVSRVLGATDARRAYRKVRKIAA